MLRVMASRGHIIGSHTDSHARLAQVSRISDALHGVETAFRRVIGEPPVLVRAPFGEIDERVLHLLHARHYLHVGWSATPRDTDIGKLADGYENGAAKLIKSWDAMLTAHEDVLTAHELELSQWRGGEVRSRSLSYTGSGSEVADCLPSLQAAPLRCSF